MPNTAALFADNLRLARLALWAGLWLGWLAELACGATQRFRITRRLGAPLRVAIAQAPKLVGFILFLAAAQHVRGTVPGATPSFDRAARRRIAPMDVFVGSLIRRRLRGLGASERLAALAALLRAPEKLIAEITRRLLRGVTRTEVHALAFAREERALGFARRLRADSS